MDDVGKLHLYITKHYDVIAGVRQKRSWASKEKRFICAELAELIRAYGEAVDFDGWDLRHVMAYIFLVNEPFHRYGRGSCWEFLKRRAQDWIVANYPECVKPIAEGRFAGYQELCFGEWSTHRPDEQWFAVRTLVVSPSAPRWSFDSFRSRAIAY